MVELQTTASEGDGWTQSMVDEHEKSRALKVQIIGPQGSGKSSLWVLMVSRLRECGLKFEALPDENRENSEGYLVQSPERHGSIKPTAWILEQTGRQPTITHYAEVADSMATQGVIVTPYYSKVTK